MNQAAEGLGTLNSEEKRAVIEGLFAQLSEQEKLELVSHLLRADEPGETQIEVSSNADLVRVSFGRPLAWFAIPRESALQLGALLLRHGGAQLEKLEQNSQSN